MVVRKPLYEKGNVVEFKIASGGKTRLRGEIRDIKVDEEIFYKVMVNDPKQNIHGETIVYEDKIIRQV